MAVEVIMPALGMAQDTGKLIAWLKQPGDPVAVGDILFEVETDKSVSEVDAQAAGYLTNVSAAEGDDVPVGRRIAMISEKPENNTSPVPAPVPPATAEPEDEAPEAAPAATPPPPKCAPVARPPMTGARILASPKARRLAAERGLDLSRLAMAGHPQPFHVADLDILAAMPTGATETTGGGSMITALGDSSAFDALLAQMKEDAGIVLEPHALVAGFAAAAFRATLEAAEARVVVALMRGIAGPEFLYADPDRTRPTRPRMAERGAEASIILRDMTGTRITCVSLRSERAPALTLGGGCGKPFSVSLAFGAALAEGAALELIEAFVRRLEAPLEHIV